MNVLIVEDDPNLRRLCRGVFGDRGYAVTETSGLAEAGQALARRRFDLMVLDLYLGREKCLALIEQAAWTNPDTGVVVVTGAAEPGLPLGAGVVHSVLRKPVDIEDLQAVAARTIAAAAQDHHRQGLAGQS